VRSRRDGAVVLELELGSLEEVERWVLSWGSHVRVLAPAVLAQRVQQTAQEIARVYREGAGSTRRQ
jgi:predicted DNA-binding transcriptional regulator YafY